MVKGFDQHQERMAALNALGRMLARRSRSRCEVCEATGVPLQAFEVPPVYGDPDLERCAFSCERCEKAMAGGSLGNPDEWRILESTAWSEVPAVQVSVVRLLRRLASDQVAWAESFLEDLYLAEEIVEWIEKSPA